MSEENNNYWDFDETEPSEEEEEDTITYEIAYYPADITLQGYVDKWAAGQLIIPPFQRNYIWDQVKASKLIESFLLGLPVPGVFLYKEKETNKLLIVDGQQRILTVIKFFKGTFGERIFRLKNVQKKWNSKTYEELDEPDKFKLQDTVLRATIIQQLSPEDQSSIFHVFERLNTGGVNLNPMEIRRCVYYGKYMEMLEEINKDDAWRKLIGKPNIDKRYRDVELILRVFALQNRWEDYEKPMKTFLNEYLISINRLDHKSLDQKISDDKKLFLEASKYLLENLGDKPFHIRGKLNYAVLDSLMVVSLECLKRNIGVDNLKERYGRLLENEEYMSSVTINTSDEKEVKARIKIASEYLLK